MAYFRYIAAIDGRKARRESSGVAAILVVAALWKTRAGYRIRRGIQQQDGELFASAFVPLRRCLILTFIMFSISTLVVIVEGSVMLERQSVLEAPAGRATVAAMRDRQTTARAPGVAR